jgi:hypothetical protein
MGHRGFSPFVRLKVKRGVAQILLYIVSHYNDNLPVMLRANDCGAMLRQSAVSLIGQSAVSLKRVYTQSFSLGRATAI